MQTVTLHQNNSGGSFWLSPRQAAALLKDGWKVDRDSSSHFRRGIHEMNFTLDVPVADEDAAITIARIEFERVTGEKANAIGCTCCGPPFHFDVDW